MTAAEGDVVDIVRKWRAWFGGAGYFPVPIRNGEKRPFLKDWPARARAGEFVDALPDPENLGTGIECSGLRAVDFDIDDDDVMSKAAAAASEILGAPAWIRYRANSPRSMWIFRAVEGSPRKRVQKGSLGSVEILGAGQQFVAIGVHPSGEPYRWDRFPPPLRDDLPAVTEEQIGDLLTALAPIVGAPSRTEGAAVERVSPAAMNASATDPGALIAAIKAGHGWHDNMLRLVAHWIARGRSDAEILAWAEPLTLSGFTVDATAADMRAMIDGARRKGFDKVATRQEAAASAFGRAGVLAADPSDSPSLANPQQGGRPKHVDLLLAIARGAELFHDRARTCFADVHVAGHRETWPVRSTGFRRWLTHEFYVAHRGAPNAEALQAATNVIEARAHFDGPERPTFLRVGSEADRLYLDLADDTWRAVEIDGDGWRDLPRAHATRVHRNDLIIETRETALVLGDHGTWRSAAGRSCPPGRGEPRPRSCRYPSRPSCGHSRCGCCQPPPRQQGSNPSPRCPSACASPTPRSRKSAAPSSTCSRIRRARWLLPCARSVSHAPG